MPSDEWVVEVKIMDRIFKQFHADGDIKKGKFITERLAKIILKEYPLFKSDLVHSYIKQRLFVRMTFLNNKIIESKKRKNRIANDGKPTQQEKKIKRLTK